MVLYVQQLQQWKTKTLGSRALVGLGQILLLSLVLPLAFLPSGWQHYLIISLIGLFVMFNLMIGLRAEILSRTLYRYLNVWLIWMVSLLWVELTGGTGSAYFFLLLIALLLGSFALRLEVSLAELGLMLVALVWFEHGMSVITWEQMYFTLTRLGSLLAFAPLSLFLGYRYQLAEKELGELYLTQQLLQTVEEGDEALIDAISAGVCFVDMELRIEEFSKAAATMTGLREVEVKGQVITDILTITDSRHADVEVGEGLLLGVLYRSRSVSQLMVHFATPQTLPFAVRLSIQPIVGKASRPVGAMLVFEDAKARAVFEQQHAGGP